MKKNKLMRLASVLLVLCLLTTSVISGTFAKYVTEDSGTDSACVAKFGVVLDVNGSLFDKTYVNAAGGNTPGTTNITVSSSNVDNVVAPGTKSPTAGMSFSIKGTPEVAVKLEAKLVEHDTTSAPKDIFLAAGDYRNWTVAGQNSDYAVSFNNAAIYYPVVFTLEETVGTGAISIKGAADALTTAGGMSNRWSVTDTGTGCKITGTLGDLNKLFDKLTSLMGNLNPNYPFDNTFKLTWEWKFEDGEDDAAKALTDAKDTLLGNLAAGTVELETGSVTVASASKGTGAPWGAMTLNNDYNLNVNFDFTISVTQID